MGRLRADRAVDCSCSSPKFIPLDPAVEFELARSTNCSANKWPLVPYDPSVAAPGRTAATPESNEFEINLRSP
jgi:hypothetical protein